MSMLPKDPEPDDIRRTHTIIEHKYNVGDTLYVMNNDYPVSKVTVVYVAPQIYADRIEVNYWLTNYKGEYYAKCVSQLRTEPNELFR